MKYILLLGGSEADNMIIKGIARANRLKGNHIITTKIEHMAVLNTCKELENEGFEVTYLDVDENGLVNINDLVRSIRKNTILISIMFANNEIGVIEPIEEIGKIARFKGIYFHTDAVQVIGNCKVDVDKMCIDALSMSSHKFYGPKGVGAAYIRNGINFFPIINGGHQEKSKRAGTENVAGIIGMGEAIKIANNEIENYNKKLLELRNYFIKKLEENFNDNLIINGDLNKRLPGNVNFYIKNMNAKEMITLLSIDGICLSSGSACNSNNPSYVLRAIKKDPQISCNSLRVTFGIENEKSDVDYIIKKIVEKLKK